jgi:type III secretory pathway component EscS
MVSLLLIGAVIPMLRALVDLQSNAMKLSTEVKMLALVFTIFTLTYLSRTLYDFIVGIGTDFNLIFSGLALPLLWDLLPIGLMLYYHSKAVYYRKKSQA